MSTSSVNKFDIVGGLPTEMALEVLSYLNAEALAVVTEVSKHWNQLSKKETLKNQLNVKTLYKRVSFIDEAAWKTAEVDLVQHGLSFEGYCVNKCKMIKELQACIAWPIEKINGVKPGVTVITFPKGLSINKLQALGPPTIFQWVNPEFSKKHGDIEVSDAYTIIMTDNVMDGTRRKDAKQQVIEIQKHGGERPKAIEAITLLVLTFLISGKRLYGEGKGVLNGKELYWYSYTRCEEQVSDHQMLVGGFVSDGFNVSNIHYDSQDYGLGAVRKC